MQCSTTFGLVAASSLFPVACSDREADGAPVAQSREAFSQPETASELALPDPGGSNVAAAVAWTFRKGGPMLRAALDEFVRTHRERAPVGNVLINRHMRNRQWVRNLPSEAGVRKRRPLYEMFRAAGAENNLDPLMLAAHEGHDRNARVDNVEQLAQRRIGPEKVRYVRNFFTYYVDYRFAAEAGEQQRNLSIN